MCVGVCVCLLSGPCRVLMTKKKRTNFSATWLLAERSAESKQGEQRLQSQPAETNPTSAGC